MKWLAGWSLASERLTFSFTPGFSRVIVNVKKGGNRLNGFQLSLGARHLAKARCE